MKYKILIKKCEDPQIASRIADEVARYSGSSAEVVYNAVTAKAVCIKKEADEEEATRLKAQFSVCGAEVDLVPLSDGGAVPPAAVSAPSAAVCGASASGGSGSYNGDDDEEEKEGRVLSDAEYAEMLKARGDIFTVEKDSRQRNTQLTALLLSVGFILFMSTRTVIVIASDFFEKLPDDRAVTLVKPEVIQETLDKKKEEEKKKKEEIKTDKKKLTPQKNQGAGGTTGGGGDPRERVTHQGVLGIVSGQIKGKSVASADIFGKGGFATDIDAILSGVGGLKSGGDGGVGRKGVAGIGYGSGYGSGFGGPGGGIDDLIGGLIGSGGGGLDLKKRHDLKIVSPDFVTGGQLTGGRSRASIQRVVMQNMAALRHAYNRRLREKPGLNGKITVKFAIDEFGKVIFAQVVETTMNDAELEQIVVARVRSWAFEKIDKPGDVTEVVYPFVFSQ